MRHRVRCAAITLLIPVALHAQRAAPTARRSGCIDSISASAMRRVPVYATAELEGVPLGRAMLLASADNFTQSIAEAARTLLGAGPGQLPPGEPTVTWRHLDHRIAVVARRDGRLTWSVQPPVWTSDQDLGDDGARLLGRALDATRAKGQSFLYDADVAADSISWVIRIESSALGADGSVTPPHLRAGFPVFTVMTPFVEMAYVDRLRTTFPMMRIRGYSGGVRMQFVIDTSGRAIPSTIRDLWPATERRPIGGPAFAYDSLVRTMRIALEGASFVPARIGGCLVSQLVQQAFNYTPSR